MKLRKKMTLPYLHSILSYDKQTGVFRWIAARPRIVVGAIAGALDKEGYRIIKIDQKNYRAARLAFFYVTGRWPYPEVDHRNLQKADDSWGNLREGTKSQNMRNVLVRANSGTGIKGVQQQKGGTFVVFVTVNKVRTKIGTFRNSTEAQCARAVAAQKLHGDFVRN